MALNKALRKKPILVIEEAIGGGDCAFAAFILGLKNVLDSLESQSDFDVQTFVDKAAKALNVDANWHSVKEKMLALSESKTGKIELQKKLVTVMREIAISRGLADPTHQERTIPLLLAAFHNHAQGIKNSQEKTKDDIYRRHKFIVGKFNEFALQMNAKNEKEIEKKLTDWWEKEGKDGAKSGYQQFMDAMAKPGTWAGDLELYQIASYFKVNLDVEMAGGVIHHIWIEDYGRIPRQSSVNEFNFTDAKVQELIDDGILKNEPETEVLRDTRFARPSGLSLLPITTEKEIERFNKLDDNAKKVIEKYYQPAPILTLSNPNAAHYNNKQAIELKPENNNTKASIFAKTLKRAEKQHKKNKKPVWKELANALPEKKEASHDYEVHYWKPDGTKTYVTKKQQEELDKQYAKELQLEEYRDYLSRNKLK